MTIKKLLPDEQKECRKGSRGTKDHLLIDKTILKDCRKRHTNLSMAWIDYRKAYLVYLVGTEHNDTMDHQRDDRNGDCEPSQASQIQKPKVRKSYTLDFKWKTVKLLDQTTQKQVKNKWHKVANFMGIPNKCLVI